MERPKLFAFTCGFASALMQLVLFRELADYFSGNELVLGLVLGYWMILTGLGAYAGAKLAVEKKRWAGDAFLLALPALAVATVFLSRASGPLTVARGVDPSIDEVLVALTLTMPAYCIYAGMMLYLAISLVQKKEGKKKAPLGYSLDSAGVVAAGVLFTLVFAKALNSFEIAYITSAFGLVILALSSKKYKIHALAGIVIVLVFSQAADLRGYTNSLQYPGQQVLMQKDTPYGNVVVSKDQEQLNLYVNSNPIASTRDSVRAELVSHIPLMLDASPKDVLLLGAGITPAVKEILKYDIDSLDVVELDAQAVDVAGRLGFTKAYEDKRVRLFTQDPRRYVQETGKKYDVVISDLGEPKNIGANRYYTSEFIGEVKDILKDGGIYYSSMPGSANYLSDELLELNRGHYTVLSKAFNHVLALPGDTVFYISSDKKIGENLAEAARRSNVEAEYANEYYLGAEYSPERIDSLKEELEEGGADLNRDFYPTAYRRYLGLWLRKHGFQDLLFEAMAAFLLVFAFALLKAGPKDASMTAAGFTSSSTLIVLMVAYQALYGYVYENMGLMIASLMAGIAYGAYRTGPAGLRKTMALSTAYSVVLALALNASKEVGVALPYLLATAVLYPLACFASGFLTGAVFSKAVSKNEGKVAQVLGLDLLGGAVGGVTTSVLLIPSVGLINVLYILGGVSAICVWRLKK